MVDNLDYSILKCLNDAERALWKKRVYQELQDQHAFLPVSKDISLQTVGRRVDNLHEQGYLENAIVSPEDVPRDLIIGYTVTDDGLALVARKRETLLQEIVRTELFGDDTVDMGEQALAELMNNEFNLDGHTEETAEFYSRDELLILMGMYFLEKKAATVFDEEHLEKFRNVVTKQQSPNSVLETHPS